MGRHHGNVAGVLVSFVEEGLVGKLKEAAHVDVGGADDGRFCGLSAVATGSGRYYAANIYL